MTEKWRVGHATVTKMVEFCSEMQHSHILPGADKELCKAAGEWIRPYVSERWNLLMSVHMMVVDLGGKRVAVDTCVGNCKKRAVRAWDNRNGTFLEDLVKAGYPPETFTHVVMTHMHDDHVGWNTVLNSDGEWVPTFPNARYLIVDKELHYWKQEYDPTPTQGNPMSRAMDDMELLADSIQPIIDHSQLDLVPSDHKIVDLPVGVVRYTPTPGHTPGHASVLIASGTEQALITGDAFHHPIQILNPHITAKHVDSDSAQATATREKLLPFLADSGVLVLGTHFSKPSGGYVKRTEDGSYKFLSCVGVDGKL
eukprot:TRINITY_DN22553_c0_g1_i1.p1 TRINITY_DN22553_c0_g1~~TRINITY_DN22553_c0_g1_i1.p1  ORF type:complete len:328 (+),score=64.32 TRINITY_DN22553_c0_g1_i1:53-985(+)